MFHAFDFEALELWRERGVEIEGVETGTVAGEAVGGDLEESAVAGEEGEGGVSVAVAVDVVVHLFGELVVWLAEVGL